MDRIGAFNIKEIGFGLICGIWNGGVFLISLDGTENKTLLSQMMGVEVPSPSIGTFH